MDHEAQKRFHALMTEALELITSERNKPMGETERRMYERARGRDLGVNKAIDHYVAGRPFAPVVTTQVGLSMGEHEEVSAEGYARQTVTFERRPDGIWANTKRILFPRVTAEIGYGADAIIIDGIDIKNKMVAGMSSMIFVGPGNAAGFEAGALTVKPDVMKLGREAHTLAEKFRRDIEANEKAQALARKNLEENEKAIAAMRAHSDRERLERLRKGFVGAQDERSAEEAWQHLKGYEAASGLAPDPVLKRSAEEPLPTEPDEGPGYCARCEVLTIPKRNQLLSMGYSVSHLIELPDEAGYAVPCRACQKP